MDKPDQAAVPRAAAHTGRHLVLFSEGTARTAADILRNTAGIRVAMSTDFDGSLHTAGHSCVAPGEGMLLQPLGIALLNGDPDQTRALAGRADPRIVLVEAERRVRACGLVDVAVAGAPDRLPARLAAPYADTAFETWGLQATGTATSRYTGRGIRLAILDTGLDFGHPDFADRSIVGQSFVEGLSCDDGNGHGTFSAGVACGPSQPGEVPRYGIACDAELYVARVLDDNAEGTDGNVLAAITWAVRNRCVAVSMSLGSPGVSADSYSGIYEQIASRARAAGTLLVAPAGNGSQRPDTIAPVEHPANCPSVLATGAVDQRLDVAPFSNGGLDSDGGELNLVAPGIAILSAAPRPTLHQMGSGTSVAVPFVAGIAALVAEANPHARGAALASLLMRMSLTLPAAARDVGAGLVQAPQ